MLGRGFHIGGRVGVVFCIAIVSILIATAIPTLSPSVKADTPETFDLLDWGPKQWHVDNDPKWWLNRWWFNYSYPAALLNGVSQYYGVLFSYERDGSIAGYSMDYGFFGGPEGDRLSIYTGYSNYPRPSVAGPMNFTLEFSFNGQKVIQNFTTMIDPMQPDLNASVSCNNTFGEGSLDVQFESNITGGYLPYKFFWSFGDGSTSTVEDPMHKYSSPGDYWATLTIIDRDLGQVTKSIEVLVVTANISAIAQTWYPSHIEFASSITGITRGSHWFYYNWDFGDGYGSTDPNPDHTYSTPGNYRVHLTVTIGNSTISKEMDVNIRDANPWGDIALDVVTLAIGIVIGAITIYCYYRWRPHRPGP